MPRPGRPHHPGRGQRHHQGLVTWRDDVGALSGTAGLAVVVWLIAWAVLHAVYRDRPLMSRRVPGVALVLVVLGALGTFPSFFGAFASE